MRVGDWVSVTERAADVPEAEAEKEAVKLTAATDTNVSQEVEMIG